MVLPATLNTRENEKFKEVGGEVAVNVTSSTISGSFSASGLFNAGRVTEVSLNSSTWTALPATALTDRNAISIQNVSDKSVKVNYDNAVSGFVGMLIPVNGERAYDIQDSIIVYGKCDSGTATVNVEELS